jgi:AcrR family transcriptional regulator
VRERPHKGPKPALSLARIVDAAVRIADTEGLDAVSMGRVAAELKAAPMSLYRHVSSKEELVKLMVDAAWGDSPGPLLSGESWRAGLSRWAWAMRAALRRHPWAAHIPISGLPIMPREIAWFEDALACMAGTGLTEARKASVILLLAGYVRNLAATEADIAAAVAASGLGPDEWMASYPAILGQLTDPRRFPALTAFIAAGVFEAADEPDDEFVFGLDRILDGVGVLVERMTPLSSGLAEVVALVEVRDEPGLDGVPAEPLLGDRAAGRDVHGREQREPAEVGVGLLAGDGGHRQIQVPADDRGDVPERHALVADRVQARARGRGLQGQPEQARGIEPVHGGPAVGPVAHVGGQALHAGDADQARDEAVIALAVHRRRQAHRGNAYAARSERESRPFGDPGMRRVIGYGVVFRGQAARREQGGPRGHDERPSGSGECFAERRDGLPVGAGGGRGVARRGEIVDVGGVDHAVRFGRAGAQAVQVGQGAAVYLGTRGRYRCGGLVRAGQAGDVVPRFEQLPDDGGADEPGRAGHENTHDALLWEGDVSRS